MTNDTVMGEDATYHGGVTYHLEIKCRDGFVWLLGRMRVGERIATHCQVFTLLEQEMFGGRESLISLYHGKMRSDFARLTGIYPLITHLSIRGDQSWMHDVDRDIIGGYRDEVTDWAEWDAARDGF